MTCRLRTLVIAGLACAIGRALSADALAQGLETAKDRDSADIYLSGSLTSADNAATVYTWDVKLTYPKVDKFLDAAKNHYILVAPRLEFTANKGTDSNVDRALVAAETQMVFSTPGLLKGTVPFLAWFNTPGLEFDRDRTTKSFVYHTALRLAFKTFQPGGCTGCEYLGFVPRLDVGFDVGHNYRNKLEPGGSGAIGRLYLGTTGYYEVGTKHLRVSYVFQLHKPLNDEIFARKFTSGDAVLSKDSKARTYFEIAPIVQVGDWVAFKPTYKRGSLPPAFNYVDNEFSISVVFAAAARR